MPPGVENAKHTSTIYRTWHTRGTPVHTVLLALASQQEDDDDDHSDEDSNGYDQSHVDHNVVPFYFTGHCKIKRNINVIINTSHVQYVIFTNSHTLNLS